MGVRSKPLSKFLLQVFIHFLLPFFAPCYIITITDRMNRRRRVCDVYIQINLESDIPIYEQLKDAIIAGIAKGELSPGEKLPSVRSLASDIGVNLHTVNKAYHQLRDDGYILIHRQRGVVVHPNGLPKADDAYINELKQSLQPLIAASICRDVSSQEFQQLCADIYQEFGQGKDDIK